MGLLASIVAYLSVVAAIVIGFVMSADVLLHRSHELAANARPEITAAAKTKSLKTKKVVEPARNAAEQRTIPRRSTATEYRRKTEPLSTRSREPHHRIVRSEAPRPYWVLHGEPAAGARALGYAEEPR